MQNAPFNGSVAIACGGTGGHLFPGRAVAEELLARGCAVTLLISPKEVDQQAAHATVGLTVVTLPAVGCTWAHLGRFVHGAWRSFCLARRLFRDRPPQAVLAMGGFTSGPPVLAGKLAGAATFLHESNSVPGRANRWIARLVDQAFLGFSQAASRLHAPSVEITGTPVREPFRPGGAESARTALGLDPKRPVLLVMGGSQGASGINDLVIHALASLKQSLPTLQFVHLSGSRDVEKVRAAYQAASLRAVVRPFLTEMELALAAATVAVSRAGGSSMAELAAMRLPSILVPYPFAADNHQFHNARAFVEIGAARMLVQKQATPQLVAQMATDLVLNEARREGMKQALAQWHKPDVAARIAEKILQRAGIPARPALSGADSGLSSPSAMAANDHAPTRSGSVRRDGLVPPAFESQVMPLKS
ncbi:MAG: undecaprenyldiphospho-muramoylpentapeptide beta-N-acetylglucosaminyltransferase [Verrucomicrobia bacterium]|nr:undecaprenyldiphospho-muramoylpentapeptide beta-N-acetylglucosaminyltransferase [Verrucomicrobiota bacterium]